MDISCTTLDHGEWNVQRALGFALYHIACMSKNGGGERRRTEGETYPVRGDRGWSAWGAVQWEGPRDRVPTALVMMVIDGGTIQTPQTLQQIKRLFCKVVKEQNGKGERSAAPARLLCSVTPSASVWFLWCHQSLGEQSCYKPFTLTHAGYTAGAACAHMCVDRG